MYTRTLAKTVWQLDQLFPVLLITGPRQVGKTTLLELCQKEQRAYVSLDDLDARSLAQHDPALFIQTYPPPVIIDEIQYAPSLLSAIKIIVDRRKENGLFWLTGSQKFQLMQGIQESLAGRVAILDLLGLSQREIANHGETVHAFLPTNTWLSYAKTHLSSPLSVFDIYERIWLGAFPRIYDQAHAKRNVFYRSYIQTYLQRDVKDLLKVSDDLLFYRFLSACAARTGQLLNYAELSRDVGIDQKTASSWLSVLMASGIIYLLQPYHNNLSKRLVKRPKLYFLDTGLCTYLSKWPNHKALEASHMSGALFETYAFIEILKSYWHNGEEAYFYYYRDTDQKEVDLLIEQGDTLYPVEFKKTATPSTHRDPFGILQTLKRTIGQGAIVCLVERDIPIHPTALAIPVWYL